PVPVVHLKATSLAAGGAANVAANVTGLGAQAYLIGLVGDDREADDLAGLLEEINISPDFLVRSRNRLNTLKTRVVAHNQQVVRIDQEQTDALSEEEGEAVWEKILAGLDLADVVVVSDYAKGLLTENLISRLIMICKSRLIQVLVDPKGQDFSRYRGASILT